MFSHPDIDQYEFKDIPLNQDIYLMDEIWMGEYATALTNMLRGGEFENVGYISYVSARKITTSSIELSWYPNIHTRFHEVRISLPFEEIVRCIGCWRIDEKPRIFVKSDWLDNLHLRSYSVFALVDAIGVKSALENGELTREKLIKLRMKIDEIAALYPCISFISFADSLLLKSNWSVGAYNNDIEYTYSPEDFIHLSGEINAAYCETIGLNVYTILTQGSNEYYDDALLHISEAQNHVSLNSLGLPFAQLMAIEHSARAAIRNKIHGPAELYMDAKYFHSLRMRSISRKDKYEKNSYLEPLTDEDGVYFYSSAKEIVDNLR